jgi:hypothetical protein
MRTDEQWADGFLESLSWRRHRHLRPYRMKFALESLVVNYIRCEMNVPFGESTPLTLVATAIRVRFVIRSRWARQAAETRRRRREEQVAREREPTFL